MVVARSESRSVLACTPPSGWGPPGATEYGPTASRAARARFPGNAAASSVNPVGVGVSEDPELDVPPAWRIRSKYGEKKNQALFRFMGPPMLPPNRFSTKRDSGSVPLSRLSWESQCDGV